MQKIKKLVLNGTEYTVTDSGAVRFDEVQTLTLAQKQQASDNLGLSGTWRRLAQLDLSSGTTKFAVDTDGCTQLLTLTTGAITATAQSLTWKGATLPDGAPQALGAVKHLQYLGEGLIVQWGPRSNAETLLKSNIATGAEADNHVFQVLCLSATAGAMEVWGK